MMAKYKLFLFFVYIHLWVYASGEIFTAISDMEALLTAHGRVVDDLQDYITKEEERLDILKRYLNIFKREHVAAMEDIPNYLGNPINAFTLIKRMTIDLELVQLNIDLGEEHASNTIITQYENTTYPSAEDLHGATLGLTRLQETYLLKVEDLAEGILNGAIDSDNDNNNMIAVSSKMSASDCFEFGRILYNETEYEYTLDWMTAALHKLWEEDNNFNTFEEIDIFQYISLSHYFLGNDREALKWANKMLELDPHHTATLEYTQMLQSFIEKEEPTLKLDGEADKKVDDKNVNTTSGEINLFTSFYYALCRGEVELSPDISKELTCRYFDESSFLKLAPIKMEYKYRNPDVVMFYDVLSDEEIETLMKIARPRLQRALLFVNGSGTFKPGDSRISKSAVLKVEDSPVVERVTRRIEDFTGLDMGTAEHLQVVNYGIGGHYLPHYDYAIPGIQYFPEKVGNRIATVLFYMSDVAQGGATAFMKLGLSLFPVRGAAVVWFNLHASGEGDRSTAHAACPVLRGSKWVSNKWIHLVGQEFRKPCGLEYQAEDMKRPLSKPVLKYSKN